jgi:hypothetical protein
VVGVPVVTHLPLDIISIYRTVSLSLGNRITRKSKKDRSVYSM